MREKAAGIEDLFGRMLLDGSLKDYQKQLFGNSFCVLCTTSPKFTDQTRAREVTKMQRKRLLLWNWMWAGIGDLFGWMFLHGRKSDFSMVSISALHVTGTSSKGYEKRIVSINSIINGVLQVTHQEIFFQQHLDECCFDCCVAKSTLKNLSKNVISIASYYYSN